MDRSTKRIPHNTGYRVIVLVALSVVLGAGLAVSSTVAQAAPLRQNGATPTPTLPPLPGGASSVVTEANLAGLIEAARAENVEWGNATFLAGEMLGDDELADFALAYAVGEAFPNFEMPTLDGGTFELAAVRGEGYLLLNFWASWCGPCQMEMPLLREAHEDPDAPFDIVMVNVWDEEAAYRDYARDDIPATLVVGRAADDLADQVGIAAIPVSVLLDAAQQIVATHVGNLTPAVMDLYYALAGALVIPVVVAEAPLPSGESFPEGLEEMAAVVERANRDGGGATIWRGGVLGFDDGFRLAVQVGEKLPAFGLMTFQGEVFRLDVSDTPYLLNFWASWCGPCVAEFPLLIEQDQDAGSAYRVAFVNVWDDTVTARRFLADYPADLLAILDLHSELPDDYGIQFIPISILVDAQGIVHMIQLGPVNEAVLTFAHRLLTIP